MTTQIADIFDVEVQYVPATPEQSAALTREFEEHMPGWSLTLSDGHMVIKPPSHVSSEQRQAIDAELANHDLGEMDVPELANVLRDCEARLGIRVDS